MVIIASVLAMVDLGIILWYAAKADAVLVQSISHGNKQKVAAYVKYSNIVDL